MTFNLLKILIISALLLGCNSSKKTTDSAKLDEISKINVSLYPYLFEEYEEKSRLILKDLWKDKYPKVELNFINYNAYKEAPPENVDVFVMDALFLSSFAEKEWILPIEENSIEDKEDILPHSLDGCLYNGQYFGIPQFGCANILFYRKTDQEIENCNTIEEFYKILGKSTYEGNKPPKGKNLLIDLSSGTSNICWYVEALMDKTGIYSNEPKLASPDQLDQESLSNVKKLISMGGKDQSRDWLPKRAEWFSDGLGRGYVGFTENMFQMKQASLNDISMKLVPSYVNSDINLFFMDAAVVNASVKDSPKRKELAIELANIISSTKHMVKSCQNENTAFYYMPARESTFESLNKQYPKYSEMFELIKNSKPKTFRLGKDAFDKINSDYKDQMETVIFN